MTKIAFLGIGLMGKPMALHLVKAGHEVTVWNRSPEKAATLVQAGARLAGSPAEAAAGAEVLYTMLSDGAAVEEMLFAKGAAEALGAGGLVIDCSSIAPSEARAHAERLRGLGIGQLDAPVSGGPSGAEAAKLAIMVGGREEDWARGEPLLKLQGRPTRVGGPGAGQLAKLANQAIVALAIGAVAEALLLANEGGADPAAVRQALTGGFADSLILQIHGQRMLDRKFLPGGSSAMHLKDMNNVLAEAEHLGLELPLSRMVRDSYARVVETFGPRTDHSGLLLDLERTNPGHRLGSAEDVLP